MSEMAYELEKQVEELTRALVTQDYRKESPLHRMVMSEVSKMASEIARVMVRENPKIRASIEAKSREVVNRVLLQDAELHKAVINAVALALADHRNGETDDD